MADCHIHLADRQHLAKHPPAIRLLPMIVPIDIPSADATLPCLYSSALTQASIQTKIELLQLIYRMQYHHNKHTAMVASHDIHLSHEWHQAKLVVPVIEPNENSACYKT